MTSRRAQQGLALITAMLVFAIVATISAYLVLGQQVWMRQTQNLFDRNRADSMRHAGLDWIAVLLTRDAKDNNTDHLGEPWAKSYPPLPFEGGAMSATITDAQSRFNLNNLAVNGQRKQTEVDVFRRLLQSLSLDPTLAEAATDWIDTKTTAGPGGAEDSEYLSLPTPYRSANQPMTSVDELRLVRGFDAKTVEKLRPYVVALPDTTAINVNTASDIVLASAFTEMPPATVQQLISGRETQPFKDLGQITQRLPPGQQPQTTLAVATSYFLVRIEIVFGRYRRTTLALMQRRDGKPTRVLWHHPIYPKL